MTPGRALRAPLLHFLVLGGVLFFAVGSLREEEPIHTLHISASEVGALESRWTKQLGRPPSEAERARLIESEIADRLLLEEAFALDWQRTDGIVRRRLIQNMRFLDPDDPASDAELLERAFDQGMDRSDIVVRRRLLERIRLALEAGARSRPPSDAELEAAYAARRTDFEIPERVRLSHVFLSRDRRGEATREDAIALIEELVSNEVPVEEAVQRSDPLLIRSALPLSSEEELARKLGAPFAAEAIRAPEGRWSGPIGSAYGDHLVWVHAREPARIPPLAEVVDRVRSDWLREAGVTARADAVDRLRAGSVIIVDDRPAR